MDNIVIRIRDRRAMLMTQSYIVNGNTGYVIEFDFDSEWDEFAEKTARFVYCDKQGARHWIDVPITGNTCNTPKLERIDRVEVGVYAGNIRTSTQSTISCIRSITCMLGKSQSMKRDFYNECMELLTLRNDPEQFKAAYNSLVSYWNNVIIQ